LNGLSYDNQLYLASLGARVFGAGSELGYRIS